jgi:hypothetical protein
MKWARFSPTDSEGMSNNSEGFVCRAYLMTAKSKEQIRVY